MKALFLKTRQGEKVFNLDNVSVIECSDIDAPMTIPSLDFWVVGEGSPYRVNLMRGTTENQIMALLRVALIPLYEGRMSSVLGIKLEMDVRDLQSVPSTEPF